MKVLFIGMGYVGTTTGLVLAEHGHTVTGVDIDQKKIDSLNQGNVYFYEPGLQKILSSHLNKNVFFTTDLKKAVEQNDLIFITVGTPSLANGSADLSYVKDAAKMIGKYINSEKTVVLKSTVPIGTTEKVQNWIEEAAQNSSPVKTVMNPEFLREGSALEDALHPDRIVIGTHDRKAANQLRMLYQNWSCPVIETTPKAAEMIKYASNSFLAAKISFINEMAKLCDKLQVNIQDVAHGMGLDPRIGPHFLKAGLGYGGSCFPKDVKELIYTADSWESPLEILNKVDEINRNQGGYFIEKIKKKLGFLKGKKAALFGLAFKPHTDDTRESVSYLIMERLLEEHAEINVHDPVVKLSSDWTDQGVKQFKDPYKAAESADVILICTDWPEYEELDWAKICQLVGSPNIFDGRNVMNASKIKKLGFYYEGIGYF
ncbi:UDP-glucose dehydrogenase family protein [Salipaludibacillus aurantiacus]|uniref:UDP-glucose 6-dehydrogenase n=1 Tax=Salipaludibacillus aurantiacus TaxID=1601833 RepID=A0A1H9X6I4_9BACI|nr:UDP-glucose/GDP-mannose dehydrogenase family protein [Salipaludibacillus aurantiacus]SES41828.1 UDPglucose 6-dehydrogenase [Salipaludibacillus aurantiacus]